MGGKATFDDLIASKNAKFEGDRKLFDEIGSLLVQFTPDFELVPGTKPEGSPTPSTMDPFEQAESVDSAGG